MCAGVFVTRLLVFLPYYKCERNQDVCGARNTAFVVVQMDCFELRKLSVNALIASTNAQLAMLALAWWFHSSVRGLPLFAACCPSHLGGPRSLRCKKTRLTSL